jgi:hypothetical protein
LELGCVTSTGTSIWTRALEIVENQLTALSKVILPTTVSEQDSEAPEAMGATHGGTTNENRDAGVAGEFGAIVALTPQPAARIANSKVVFVLLMLEAFLSSIPNQFSALSRNS